MNNNSVLFLFNSFQSLWVRYSDLCKGWSLTKSLDASNMLEVTRVELELKKLFIFSLHFTCWSFCVEHSYPVFWLWLSPSFLQGSFDEDPAWRATTRSFLIIIHNGSVPCIYDYLSFFLLLLLFHVCIYLVYLSVSSCPESQPKYMSSMMARIFSLLFTVCLACSMWSIKNCRWTDGVHSLYAYNHHSLLPGST